MALADSYLAVARVAGAHGVRGELRCEVITDFPDRLKRTHRLYSGETHTPLDVERARLQGGRGAILKIVGIDSREDAERLRGQMLYVPEADAVPLSKGTYFWHQIIGLRVRSLEGQDLGTVTEILQTGSNDVYVVRDGQRETLIPAIKDVVKEIDLTAGVMTIEVVEGLLS
jgi:16S rRNA processing protein RimM